MLINTNVTRQILFGVSYIHRKLETITNLLFFDMFNNTVLYSVAHDIIDPYVKTYCSKYIPFYVTIKHNMWGVSLSKSSDLFEKPPVRSNDHSFIFYHDCLVHERMIKYVISSSPHNKLTSDFQKLDYISIDIEDNDDKFKTIPYFHCIYTDIALTANHLCTFAKMFLGSKVRCMDNNLEEIIFKDTDIIHNNHRKQ